MSVKPLSFLKSKKSNSVFEKIYSNWKQQNDDQDENPRRREIRCNQWISVLFIFFNFRLKPVSEQYGCC